MPTQDASSQHGTEVARVHISKASPRRLQAEVIGCPAALRVEAERIANLIGTLAPWPATEP